MQLPGFLRRLAPPISRGITTSVNIRSTFPPQYLTFGAGYVAGEPIVVDRGGVRYAGASRTEVNGDAPLLVG